MSTGSLSSVGELKLRIFPSMCLSDKILRKNIEITWRVLLLKKQKFNTGKHHFFKPEVPFDRGTFFCSDSFCPGKTVAQRSKYRHNSFIISFPG